MISRPPADLTDVRDSYDRVADTYAELVDSTGMGDLVSTPWLLGAVDAFAAATVPLGPLLDVGCGPGTVTAHLAARGADVLGVDLSPGMVDRARTRHPQCRFEVASATELDLAPASWGGILGWWSLFNLPRDIVGEVVAGFAGALVPGGQLLVALHAGEGERVRTEAYGGVPVAWTTHLWRPEEFTEVVRAAGLRVVADLRLPAPDPQSGPAFVLCAEKPPTGR